MLLARYSGNLLEQGENWSGLTAGLELQGEANAMTNSLRLRIASSHRPCVLMEAGSTLSGTRTPRRTTFYLSHVAAIPGYFKHDCTRFASVQC
mmetsp:Transcript_35010/g.75750  ORF Transcript_35010/g.75750 Transcript_35010/m.75750 type:complete len:93 (+) Transcript_35010:226-504(+)